LQYGQVIYVGKGVSKMDEQGTILTKEGLKQLEDELDNLRSVKRAEVAERLKVAISYGDISENSEYDDAKNEQAFVEGRIAVLEKMIRNAQIINGPGKGDRDKVVLGCEVTIRDMETKDTETYRVVGTTEADPMAEPPRISNESPVGKAILGEKVGKVVLVATPAGELKYKIVDIQHKTKGQAAAKKRKAVK
jgi:transcription elongation factor GreA